VTDDRYYFAARAAEERRAAMASSVLKAWAIHLELAARYDDLVEGKSSVQASLTNS
jgi:hypothetical protein